jgi:hypothetical protein
MSTRGLVILIGTSCSPSMGKDTAPIEDLLDRLVGVGAEFLGYMVW